MKLNIYVGSLVCDEKEYEVIGWPLPDARDIILFTSRDAKHIFVYNKCRGSVEKVVSIEIWAKFKVFSSCKGWSLKIKREGVVEI